MECPRCKCTCYCWYPSSDGVICGCCFSLSKDYPVPVCEKYSRVRGEDEEED